VHFIAQHAISLVILATFIVVCANVPRLIARRLRRNRRPT
jgi:hypothetical protein